MMNRMRWSLLLCLVAVEAAWAAPSVSVAWKIKGDGGFSAPNAIMDSATGRVKAIVVGEGNVGVACFDLGGKRLWQYRMGAPVTAVPAVGDVNGDGSPDIVEADATGKLAVLTAEGKALWTAQLPGAVQADSYPAIADLDGDGKAEILAGDTSGTLSCFDHTGALRWQFSGDGGQLGPVLVADIYTLPGKEIIVTSLDQHIYALSAKGKLLWDIYCPEDLFPNSTPVLADVNGDGVPELYVGGGLNHFYQIDLATGKITFKKNVYLHINGAIQGTDLNGDGKDEVVFCTKGGATWCYGANGFEWQHRFRDAIFLAAPSVVSLNPGPKLDLLMYSQRGALLALDADGHDLFSAKIPGLPSTSPLVGDLSGNGKLELIETSPGGTGGAALMCLLKTNLPYHANDRNRVMVGQDCAHTGRAPGAKTYTPLSPPATGTAEANGASATPAKPLALFTGLNTWRFDVTNPKSLRLALVTSVTGPAGVTRRYVRHVRAKEERVALSLNVHAAGNYTVRQRLVEADRGLTLATLERSLNFKGIASDAEYLSKDVFNKVAATAKAWEKTNPGAAAFARSRLVSLKGMLSELRGEKAPDPALVGSLRESAERLRALTEAGAALAPKGTFFAWQYNPWAYFDARATLPTPADRTEQLDTALCIGGYGSLALNLTNVSGHTLDIRATVGDASGPEAAPAAGHIELRQAVTVPTVRRQRVADALPRLDDAGLARVASAETEQLWITVNARGLKPGNYEFKLKLRSLEVDPTEVDLPIRVKVYPLALPQRSPLRVCVWSYDGGDLGTDKPAVLKDLVNHGVNVFFVTPPSATCNADGKLVGAIDFAKHDEAVRRLSPHGLILFPSPQSRLKGQPFLSAPWKKAFIAYLRRWTAHLKQLGLGYGQWALYPYDEPSSPYNQTTQNLVAVAKIVREADPRILIYADPTSGTTMKTVEMFKGLIDIWCPSAELLDRLGPELVPVAKKVAKEVWFYDAAGGAKTLSCLGLYRWRFWHAWTEGFTGVGWWDYAIHGPSRWDGPNSTGNFYPTVYGGTHGPVSSKRWEAARQGVQDYELLYLLRQEIEKHKKAGDTSPEVAAAEQALKEIPGRMDSLLSSAGRRLALTPDSVPLYDSVTQSLNEARAEIVKCCIELNK